MVQAGPISLLTGQWVGPYIFLRPPNPQTLYWDDLTGPWVDGPVRLKVDGFGGPGWRAWLAQGGEPHV